MANFWDELYLKSNKYVWGLKPHKLTITAVKLLKVGTALDLGAGEGKDSIYLAKHGFNVLAVDSSQEGLKKLQERAEKRSARLRIKNAKIQDFKFNETYDLIICLNTIHFLKHQDIKDLIEKMKRFTKAGGINIITAFNVDDVSAKMNNKRAYNFNHEELKEVYKDWKILHYNEFISKPESHPGMEEPHRHGITEIIARKIKP